MDRQKAIALAEELYRALAVWDVPALDALFHPRFQGRTTAGLPLGLGGSYDGPEAMRGSFYAKIGRNFDAKAVPARFAMMEGDDRLMVQGEYVGHARAQHGGGELRAEFVHFIGFADDRIVSLEQITDSHAWHEALKQPGDAR
jgi:2-(1,2-epoxy-1,2-dihydrophenyl)acetyl-CoA isomerase